ncbi:MAG: hypothetical protein LAP86_25815 [Acidobacteriia bacterium]|nr:hypothetical protein [Terriglobia bacterium]
MRIPRAADAAQIPAEIDEDVLAAYHAEIAEQATVAEAPPTLIQSVENPANAFSEAVDSGVWTAEGGMQWESDRAALIQRVEAQRRANLGNHASDRPGTAIVDGLPEGLDD